MSSNRFSRIQRASEIMLLVAAFIAGSTDANPTQSTETVSTTPIPSTSTNASESLGNLANSSEKARGYQSGDTYLDGAYKDCLIAKDMTTCIKYRALRYVHEMTSPFEESGRRGIMGHSEYRIGESLKLVALPPHSISEFEQPLFSESKSRSSDSEFMKLFRFTLREVERFVRSYALTINVPMAMSSGRSADDVATPRFIDSDFFSGTLKEVASRDKKKTLMFLLPLISFFHLKALLVPILLAVLFIKKLLVLGVVFLPSLLSLVKWCKPMHHHHVPWYPEPEPPIDYHSEYSPHYEHHKSRHTGHGDHAVTYSEDHHVAPDENRESWSGRNHYPGRGDKPSWNSHKHDSGAQTEGPPKQGWGDPIMSPAVMVTPTLDTEVTAGSSAGSSSFGVDEIRGSWGTSKRRNSVSRYTDREDSDTWGSGRHAEDEGRMSSYKAPLTNHNWDTKPAKTLEKDIGETLRQSWGRDQPDATGRGWNDDDTSADSDNTQRYHYTWSRDKGHSRPEKPRAGWGGTSDDSNVEETVDEVNIWPEVRNSKKYDSSITTEEVANNVGAPRERVGDSQTTPSDTRVVNQTNRPTGERRKKKCDNKEIPASTSNAERDADKISPITKPEISGNYSVLKNHRL
ncbi:uncharacterized protein [Periplaneta americana]|uniref:uncharacterized protein n=1 Tax=Periplaneta americana TaxID=6978 RepID=UPI0037E8E640